MKPVQQGLQSPESILEGKPAPPRELGSYEIRGILEPGAMGVVYLAYDKRLERPVALKLLPDALANHAHWLARLETEARTLATINHANVAAVYGLERSGPDHPAFVVMEFVGGQTLRDKLRSGRLNIESSIRLAVQIAAGLEAAHNHGVVHRDLKPDNIKVTPRGEVKILDFGVALREGESPHGAPEVCGTHGYISPEQYRTGAADRRSDIFALGCVLFECLTGERCFPGQAPEEIMLATLDDEPEWLKLPARTPRRIHELLFKCLQKDPQHRLRDAGDARIELEMAIGGREWTDPRKRIRRTNPALIALGCLATGVGATYLVMRAHPPAPPPKPAGPVAPINVVISEPGVPVCGSMGNTSLLAISPDGTRVVYASPRESQSLNRLMLWESDRGGARELSGQGLQGYDPTFSPDGRTICYVGPGLMRTTGADVAPREIWTGMSIMKGLTWSGGEIVLSPHPTGGLVSIASDGNHPPMTLTLPDYTNGELSHRYPDSLPDGKGLLFTLKRRDITSFDDAEVHLLDVRTGTWRRLLRGASFARWSPSGHVLFMRGGTIHAAAFDLASQSIVGPAVPVLEGVMYEPGSGAAQFAIARESGALAYIPGGAADELKELCWLDETGAVSPLGAPLRDFSEAAISPDGSRLVTVVSGASDALFVHELGRGALTRLSFGGNAATPAWMPDSRRVVFATDAAGGWELFEADIAGASGPEQIVDLPACPSCVAVAQQGDATYAVLCDAERIQRVRIDGPAAATSEVIANVAGGDGRVAVARDGSMIAFTSAETGRGEVYVRRFAAAGSGETAVKVTTEGGFGVQWLADGTGIIYSMVDAAGRTVLATAWPADGAKMSGAWKWRKLVEVPAGLSVYPTVAPSGLKVLCRRSLPPTYRADRVCLILNFAEQVRQKAPRTNED